MRICEYIKALLSGCPLLSGECILIEFFDEKVGGVGLFENHEKKTIREYTDGTRLSEKSVKIVLSHIGGMGDESEISQRDFAEGICDYLESLDDFGNEKVSSIECEIAGTSGEIGVGKQSIECRVRFLERIGD